MAYYRVCPDCHAYLDAGELCDCRKPVDSQSVENLQKRAAPSAANTESGKVENGLEANISTHRISKNKGKSKEVLR